MTLPFRPSDLRALRQLMTEQEPHLRAAAAQMQRVQEQLGAELRQWSESYRKLIADLMPFLKRAAEEYTRFDAVTHKRVGPILRRRGWFGVSPHLNVVEYSKALAVFDRRGSDAFDKYVCSRFSVHNHKRLRGLVRRWWTVRYLAKRRHIILAAVRAHEAKNFSLSVAALLPLADGLAAAFFRANPTLRPTRPGKVPTVWVKDAATLHRDPKPDNVALLQDALARQIYSRYEFGRGRAPSSLNRHGILHGEIAQFGTERNSLRAFLLLDVLATIALAGPKVP